MNLKFSLGDKVSFLNEKREGKVTKIKGNIIEVTGEDGFPIPVVESEIIKIGGNQQSDSSSPLSVKSNFSEGFHLLLTPKTHSWEVHLYNHERQNNYVQLRQKIKGSWVLLWSGEIIKDTYTKVTNIPLDEIGDFREITLQKIAISWSVKTLPTPIHLTLKISVRDFTELDLLNDIEIINQKGLHYKFSTNSSFEDHFEKKSLKTISFKEAKSKNDFSQNKIGKLDCEDEIDLHIEHLVPNYKNLSNAEIIEIQLNAAEKAINKAYRNQTNQIILVHGKGKGILKSEITKLLKYQYQLNFKPMEGNPGATIVYL